MNTSLLSTLARLVLTVTVMVVSLNSFACETTTESTDKKEDDTPASEAMVSDFSFQLAEADTEETTKNDEDTQTEAISSELNWVLAEGEQEKKEDGTATEES